VAGIRELLTDGANGLVCEPDAASLRAALGRGMDDSELRGRLGRAARAYAEEHFSLARVVDLELAVLNGLAG
jgi:glycosyltransferase involved in cell wall biosynthesis